jgi:exodeoxyribonuclease VII large subunit
VTELVTAIDEALQAAFPGDVWVEGEISALKAVPIDGGRHIFFDLVEPVPEGGGARPKVALPVKLFDSQRQRVNAYLRRHGSIKMTDGVRVRISGTLQHYPARSQVELRMNLLDPSYTLALLATEREEVLRRLSVDGLLDRNAERPLSPVPLRVGLVTSAASAAAADFLHELELSGFGWQVLLADTRVQGTDADQSIVLAVEAAIDAAVDVVAIVRGGGSRTELATFDAETIARAIAASAVPVFTGIGHEIDDSVADRVAHSSFKTPTACAAGLVQQVSAFLARCDDAAASLQTSAARRCRAAAERVERTGSQIDATTRWRLEGQRSRVDELARRLAVSAPAALGRATVGLEHLEARVHTLDPARALARGWSITRRADGRTVRSVDDVASGDELVTTLVDGTVASRVEDS